MKLIDIIEVFDTDAEVEVVRDDTDHTSHPHPFLYRGEIENIPVKYATKHIDSIYTDERPGIVIKIVV